MSSDHSAHALSGAEAIASVDLYRWTAEGPHSRVHDLLAREEPLEIRVQGRCIAVTMRTPGHDAELAAGFLMSEGLISQAADVLEIAHCLQAPHPEYAQNIVNVFLAPQVTVDFAQLTRHVYTTSSCGVCGKASIESIRHDFPHVESLVQATAEMILQLPDRLRAEQHTFAQTGGLHAAAVFTVEGDQLVMREDVGRHNAVDKCVGFALLNRHFPLDQHILLVSGRASFEIMQKAWAAGIPIVAAISAPSSLAVECARESGQTLLGFVRGDSMNVYTGGQRLNCAPATTRLAPGQGFRKS